MIKAVLDTNIILSSIFWKSKPYGCLKRGILKEYQLVTSVEIIDEVVKKLREKFGYPEDKIQELVDFFFGYIPRSLLRLGFFIS